MKSLSQLTSEELLDAYDYAFDFHNHDPIDHPEYTEPNYKTDDCRAELLYRLENKFD